MLGSFRFGREYIGQAATGASKDAKTYLARLRSSLANFIFSDNGNDRAALGVADDSVRIVQRPSGDYVLMIPTDALSEKDEAGLLLSCGLKTRQELEASEMAEADMQTLVFRPADGGAITFHVMDSSGSKCIGSLKPSGPIAAPKAAGHDTAQTIRAASLVNALCDGSLQLDGHPEIIGLLPTLDLTIMTPQERTKLSGLPASAGELSTPEVPVTLTHSTQGYWVLYIPEAGIPEDAVARRDLGLQYPESVLYFEACRSESGDARFDVYCDDSAQVREQVLGDKRVKTLLRDIEDTQWGMNVVAQLTHCFHRKDVFANALALLDSFDHNEGTVDEKKRLLEDALADPDLSITQKPPMRLIGDLRPQEQIPFDQQDKHGKVLRSALKVGSYWVSDESGAASSSREVCGRGLLEKFGWKLQSKGVVFSGENEVRHFAPPTVAAPGAATGASSSQNWAAAEDAAAIEESRLIAFRALEDAKRLQVFASMEDPGSACSSGSDAAIAASQTAVGASQSCEEAMIARALAASMEGRGGACPDDGASGSGAVAGQEGEEATLAVVLAASLRDVGSDDRVSISGAAASQGDEEAMMALALAASMEDQVSARSDDRAPS